MAMALVLLKALLLLASAAGAAAMDNTTGAGSSNNTSPVLCNGAECEPPGKPLPIYGYPPSAPSLPSAPPTPPSVPGSQTPCPPVLPVVCCGGAGGQYTPQQPNYYGPPTGVYVPYQNAAASPPALLVPITLVGHYVMVACIFILWLVV
ncbi:hypothetical protein BAE44_0002973 [Dichanthelium oligosanthes]|uniref:Uncharacterized protein n=1 Tax=Dichanthelium oligosanthes TaxID=888268 RepID=A0A1E5WFE2_9POAL|nr:hypothetical protein BAE44_0002973 [Dichanthelium oligosanthes]